MGFCMKFSDVKFVSLLSNIKKGRGVVLDPVSGQMSVVDVTEKIKSQIASILDVIPSSSDMNQWNESTRQELVWNPIRVVFSSPLRIDFHQNVVGLAYSLTNGEYPLLGSAVDEGVICYASHRVRKSYNREIMSEDRVNSILRKKIDDEASCSDIALMGRLIATRNVSNDIVGLFLLCGGIELTLNMNSIVATFGDLELFLRVNGVMTRNSNTPQARVYVLCRDQAGDWSVRNWANPISQLDDEPDNDYNIRIKSTLRDRNRFKVKRTTSTSSNLTGLTDEKGIYYSPII
jgi:hypothetical protein